MPRGRPGESRYREKWRSTIPFEDYVSMLHRLEETGEQSLLTILYYTGLRIAEVCGDGERKWKVLTSEGKSFSRQGKLVKGWMDPEYENTLWVWKHRKGLPGIVKEDIKINEGLVKIYSKPLKHGKREGEGLIELDMRFPFMDLVAMQVEATEVGERVWPFTTHRAWVLITRASGGKLYPHAFRLSRATRMAEDPGIALADLMAWFGWSRVETPDAYVVGAKTTERARRSIERELPR
jgi:integrase